jgi:hypothetical protein
MTKLNAKTAEERLKNLVEVKKSIDKGELKPDLLSGSVNNHIHTIYSFSPYSPTLAVFMAWKNGLTTAGIMDHDSIGGAHEFLKAGEIMNMAVTAGIECRVSMKNTKLNGKRINNPDQKSVAYVALHGVPHGFIDTVNDFFAPYREKRNIRNKKMCESISHLTAPFGITLDFEQDVLPISNFADSGSVTERHLLFALAKKIATVYKTPDQLVDFLKNGLKMDLSDKVSAQLLSAIPEYYLYDVLGALKGNLVEKFYIDADEECPDVTEYIALAKKTGAISAYAYLGDVGNSVTGDKKAQTFEDEYIDLLFAELSRLGFNAVTYMPTRNTEEQLNLVMQYCDNNGFFQISGEDINSPRQSFICKALEKENFKHLFASTYALIGHEKAATENADNGMFTAKTIAQFPLLPDRIKHFEAIGRA